MKMHLVLYFIHNYFDGGLITSIVEFMIMSLGILYNLIKRRVYIEIQNPPLK